MSPKAMTYRGNSIIYFVGDVNDKIYIMKSGRISLQSKDIETGKEDHELIKTGEFFGVKSALGKYPREETAVVLTDSTVLMFEVPEFEALTMKNTRIILKMLKVFSNQLRRIHKQVRNLISKGQQVNAEEGLFRIGEYYLKNRQYNQALYAFQRYLTYYPSGEYAKQATDNIQLTEQYSQQFGQGQGPAPSFSSSESKTQAAHDRPASGKELSDVAKLYYDAVSMFSQERYDEALKAFSKIVMLGSNPEYSAKSEYEIGRCFYCKKEYDKCIKTFTSLVQKYPKHPDMPDALYHIGKCHEHKANTDKAISFYKMILTRTSEGDSVYRKVKKSLRTLQGAT